MTLGLIRCSGKASDGTLGRSRRGDASFTGYCDTAAVPPGCAECSWLILRPHVEDRNQHTWQSRTGEKIPESLSTVLTKTVPE